MASVSLAVSGAFERTKLVLFRPFDLGRWMALGFAAFLAGLGEGGGFNFSFPNGGGRSGGGGGGPFAERAETFVSEHWFLILPVAVLGYLALLGVVALVTWLSSRGKFMLIDNVVHNRAAIREPWGRFRDAGNSLFVVRFSLWAAMATLCLGVVVAAGLYAWPDVRAQHLSYRGAVAIAGTVCILGIYVPAYAVVTTVIKDFGVPIMYLHGAKTIPALGLFFRDLLPGNVGSIILFYLAQAGLGMGAAVVILLGTCCTCCMAGLPYVSSVVFLPLHVFFVSYRLHFLDQLRPEWHLFPEDPPAGVAPLPSNPPPAPSGGPGYWEGAPRPPGS